MGKHLFFPKESQIVFIYTDLIWGHRIDSLRFFCVRDQFILFHTVFEFPLFLYKIELDLKPFHL